MPPRTRRTAAAAAAAAMAADLQMESDAEMESDEVDVEAEDEEGLENNEGDDEEEAEVEASGEEDSQSVEEEDEVGPSTKPATHPTLKITLKLPANTTFASNNSPGTATPEELDYIAFKRTPRRRAKTKVIQDIDIESEDPSSPSAAVSDDGAQSARESGSRSTGTPSTGVKPMTTRQAVLASVVDSSHVSLNEGSRSKKQPLNESELALRREETARKRKNMSEKKLEDEKAETINRLLKKQSRPKNKRTTALGDRSPLPSVSGSRTPKNKTKSNLQEEGEEVEGEEEEDEPMDIVEEPPEEVKPIMYRWVSSLRVIPSSTENDDRRVEMGITFSVPEAFVPAPVSKEESIESEKIRAARGPGTCAVEGCGKPRKYRVPRDWTIGACDSTHLRLVAEQV